MIEKKLMEITQVKEPIVTGKSYGLGIRHLQVACMSLCTTALFVARSNMGVAVLAMTDHNRTNGTDIYSWDKRTQSYILSAFFWGYMIMQVPSGLLAKRFGGKPILLFALLANGLLTCLIPVMAKWGGWPLVCMCRVGMGLTQACLFSSIHTLFGVWLPAHERTTYSGLVHGGSSVGTIVGLSISGVLANTVLGWKMIFYATGAFMSLLAVIWWQLAANNPMEHKLISKFEIDYINSSNSEPELKRSLSVPWKCIFLCKGFYAIAIAHISTAILFGTLFVEIPTYLEKGLKMSLDKSASLSALPYIGVFLSSILSSYICDKLVNGGYLSLNVCRKLFNSIALFGSAGALISLNFVKEGHEMLTMVALTTVQTLSGFTCAGFLVNHLDLSPNYAGVMIAMTNCFANVGSVVTPILTSFILQNDPTDVSRWRIVFGLIASLLIISNIIYVVLGVTTKQPWDDPQYLDKLTSHSDELSPVLKTEKIVSEENKTKELSV